ncbi:hypothetical protein [Planococcus salinarum]|uniref:hypothetical protein n=1 Tax=Planococcus salinarum TaxID=622695 RepID=UPI000AFC0928|nr:hypothetical protein [Planococcus salinarum]
MTTLWQRLKFAVATDMDAILDKKEEKNTISLLNKYILEAEKETQTAGKWLERQTSLSLKLDKELQDAESVALEQRYEEMKHKVKDMKVRQLQLMGKENATRALPDGQNPEP